MNEWITYTATVSSQTDSHKNRKSQIELKIYLRISKLINEICLSHKKRERNARKYIYIHHGLHQRIRRAKEYFCQYTPVSSLFIHAQMIWISLNNTKNDILALHRKKLYYKFTDSKQCFCFLFVISVIILMILFILKYPRFFSFSTCANEIIKIIQNKNDILALTGVIFIEKVKYLFIIFFKFLRILTNLLLFYTLAFVHIW